MQNPVSFFRSLSRRRIFAVSGFFLISILLLVVAIGSVAYNAARLQQALEQTKGVLADEQENSNEHASTDEVVLKYRSNGKEETIFSLSKGQRILRATDGENGDYFFIENFSPTDVDPSHGPRRRLQRYDVKKNVLETVMDDPSGIGGLMDFHIWDNKLVFSFGYHMVDAGSYWMNLSDKTPTRFQFKTLDGSDKSTQGSAQFERGIKGKGSYDFIVRGGGDTGCSWRTYYAIDWATSIAREIASTNGCESGEFSEVIDIDQHNRLLVATGEVSLVNDRFYEMRYTSLAAVSVEDPKNRTELFTAKTIPTNTSDIQYDDKTDQILFKQETPRRFYNAWTLKEETEMKEGKYPSIEVRRNSEQWNFYEDLRVLFENAAELPSGFHLEIK